MPAREIRYNRRPPIDAPAPTMMDVDLREKTELGDIYNLPGEGFVVELRQGGTTHLFDRQGLQHRILEKRRQNLDAAVEGAALVRINHFSPMEPVARADSGEKR